MSRKQDSEKLRKKRAKEPEKLELVEISVENQDTTGTYKSGSAEDNINETGWIYDEEARGGENTYGKDRGKKDKGTYDCCKICCKYKDDNCNFACDSHRELLIRIICLLIDNEYGLKAIAQRIRNSQQDEDIDNVKSITRLLEEAIKGLGETAVGAVKKAVEAAGTMTDITEGLAKIAAGVAGTAGSLALASSGTANVVSGTALTASAAANTVAASANVVADTALTASAAANTVAGTAAVVGAASDAAVEIAGLGAGAAAIAGAGSDAAVEIAGLGAGTAAIAGAASDTAVEVAGQGAGAAAIAGSAVDTAASAAEIVAGTAGTAAAISDTTAAVAGTVAGAAETANAIASTTAAVAGTATAVAQTTAATAGIAAATAQTGLAIANTMAATAGTVAATAQTASAAANTVAATAQTTSAIQDAVPPTSQIDWTEYTPEDEATEDRNINNNEAAGKRTEYVINAVPSVICNTTTVTTGPVILCSGFDTVRISVLNNYKQTAGIKVFLFDLTCSPKCCCSMQGAEIPASCCSLFTIQDPPAVYEVQIQGVNKNIFANVSSCDGTSGFVNASNIYRSSDLMPVQKEWNK